MPVANVANLIHIAIATLIALALSACAGAPTGAPKVVKDGMAATAMLPDVATDKVRAKAKLCDDGDPIACDWVGVWFLVGGGGQEHVSKSQKFFDFACKHGYRRGCVHLQQMERGEHKL